MVARRTHITCSTCWVECADQLPLQSFNMEAQHEMAFRVLQNGINTGKIVVRVAAKATGCHGVHIVAGGTGGRASYLVGGLRNGAPALVLASRSGALAKDMGAEWKGMGKQGHANARAMRHGRGGARPSTHSSCVIPLRSIPCSRC